MDEELMDIITEQNIEVKPVEVIENEVTVEYDEYDVPVEETAGTIEVEITEEVEIEMDEAIGWVGGDSERHYSLLGRDEPNQHPITAITGLRKELDDIEKLQTVFSDKYNHANYYKWQMVPATPIGLFVSCPTADYIKVCNSTDDIFGVTVESAAFIGGQDDIERGDEYGLVVCSGVVAVKCELDVVAGDSVVSNSSGYAKKAEGGYGYKVIGIQNINGVLYAIIPLNISVNQVNALMMDLNIFETRLNKVETDIVSAINVAQQAYNKAETSSEASSVSAEVVKDALEKVLGVENDVENIYRDFVSTNITAVQAKAIAESAITEAASIRISAEKTANDALANVNDLIKDLEPITTWSYTDEAGEVHEGAEYFRDYVNNGVATKVEIHTVETLTEENKTSIEKSAESFRTLVSSVDKYSVGEYSQAYGLSREQAKSVLKIGMIYVPTKHKGTDSHSETFIDESEPQWFTPGSYYEWDGEDWIEYGNSVAFGMNIPTYTSQLRYWYVDNDSAPYGYEPYTLYSWINEKWTKVNIYYNNPSNRMVSAISQDVDNISLEIVNARGSYSGLGARLTNTEAEVDILSAWKNGNAVNEAIIRQVSNDNGASIVISTLAKEGETFKESASLTLSAKNGEGGDSFLAIDAKNINFTADDYNVIANNINLTGYVTFEDLSDPKSSTKINGGLIETETISASSIKADSAMIALIDALDITAKNVAADAIKSNNYEYTSGMFSNKGTFLDLTDGSITSPGFAIDSFGNSFFNGVIYAKGGELNGALSFGDSTSGYVLNSDDYYINIPGFQVGKSTYEYTIIKGDKKEVKVNTYATINGVRLASVLLNTEKGVGADPQMYINDDGIWLFESNSYINNWGCVCWNNIDGTSMMRLRGGSKKVFSNNNETTHTGIILEGLDYLDTSLDFYAFGMSMRDMLNRIIALESASGHEHTYYEISNTATCTTGGQITKQCSCGAIITEMSYQLGHRYFNGYCERCGEKEPSDPGGGGTTECSHNYEQVSGDTYGCVTELLYECTNCGDYYRTYTTRHIGFQLNNGLCSECFEPWYQ